VSQELGLSNKEIKQYSIMNAIRYLSDIGRDRKKAEFELFCSDMLAERTGSPAQGIYIPAEVLGRDLTVGTATAGGNMVGTEKNGFLDLLREQSALERLGATFMSDLVGNVDLPGQSAAGAVDWIAENANAPEADPTFSNISLSPKTVAAYTNVSRRLTLQSSIDINDYVVSNFAKSFAAELDRVAIEGVAASNEPAGILNTSGIGSVALGTNGAAITWGDIADLEKELAQDKAIGEKPAILTNYQVAAKLRTTEKVSSTGQFILGDSNVVAGYPFVTSSEVPADGTKGTGTNLSTMIFGSWENLIVGQWGAPVDVVVDQRALIDGVIKLSAFMDVDIGVAHPESFAAITDIVTT